MPKFIDNRPIGEDLFEAKSQQRTAEALCSVILDNKIDSKLVGLDGPWGAGKSNVIEIVRKNLDKTHYVFVYDAWGHQEDLQRRAFLEELTADLCEQGLLDKNHWGKKLESLLSKRSKTQTKTIPRLSLGIVITALIAVLTPIASTFGDALESDALSVTVTALPLLCGIAIWMVSMLVNGKFLGVEDLYRIYKDHELEDTTETIISESEPSVRQFTKWMSDLSSAIHEKDLIVVFDNMDRLPSDKVRELWSSIHTFFAEAYFGRIWVVVPFDRKHIAEAFDNDPKVAEQFLNKSFQVIFRVATPVLSDWKSFFELKYRQAFGNEEESDLDLSKKVFDFLSPEITPRSIIGFLNEVVALKITAEEGVRVRYVSAFVLAKRHILEDPVGQILSLECLGSARVLFNGDHSVADQLAAVAFQVPLEAASQVPLAREIETAIRLGDGKRLSLLSSNPHYADVLDQVVAAGSPVSEKTVEALVSYFDNSETDFEDRNAISIWDYIAESEGLVDEAEQLFTESHRQVLSRCSERKCRVLVSRILKSIEAATVFSGTAYFESLDELERSLKDRIDCDFSLRFEPKSVSPSEFLKYLKSAGNKWKLHPITCDNAELNKYFSETITIDPSSLAELVNVRESYDTSEWIESIEVAIAEASVDENQIADLLHLHQGLVSSGLLTMFSESALIDLIKKVPPDNSAYPSLLAMRLAYGDKIKPPPNLPDSTLTALDQDNQDLLDSVTSVIERYSNLSDLLTLIQKWPNPFLNSVVDHLVVEPVGTSRLNVKQALKNFQKILDKLTATPSQLIVRLDGWSGVAAKEINKDNVASIVTSKSFFTGASEQRDLDLVDIVVSAFNEHFNEITTDNWKTCLTGKTSPYDILVEMLNCGFIAEAPAGLVVAFREHLRSLASGTISLSQAGDLEPFYEKINKNKLKSTFKDIRDQFISSGGITPEMFLLFMPMLLRTGSMVEKSGDVIRRICFPVVENLECLKLMSQHSKLFGKLISRAGDDAVEFIESLQSVIELNSDQAEIVAFGEYLNID